MTMLDEFGTACEDLGQMVKNCRNCPSSSETEGRFSFLPGLYRVPNRPTAPPGAGHGVGRVPAGVREAVLRLPHKSRTGINFGRP